MYPHSKSLRSLSLPPSHWLFTYHTESHIKGLKSCWKVSSFFFSAPDSWMWTSCVLSSCQSCFCHLSEKGNFKYFAWEALRNKFFCCLLTWGLEENAYKQLDSLAGDFWASRHWWWCSQPPCTWTASSPGCVPGSAVSAVINGLKSQRHLLTIFFFASSNKKWTLMIKTSMFLHVHIQ